MPFGHPPRTSGIPLESERAPWLTISTPLPPESMNRLSLSLIGAAALCAFGAIAGQAQIERLTLKSMVQKTDDAIFAEITNKEVIRIDHPVDGPELYFTHITLRGESLKTGELVTQTVTFPGGFINDEEGVWNSEAPSADDIKIGNLVVAFSKHVDNLGGDLACNALYASHGGLFRTVNAPNGIVVLGRGDGYAIDKNISLEDLDAAITNLSKVEEL
jgi:hypothetical protein